MAPVAVSHVESMTVHAPQDLDRVLAASAPDETWLAVPPGEGDDGVPRRLATGRLLVLVGPEGGFSEAEQQAARAAGARPVRLGTTVLRVETAAVALVVLARV